MERDYETIIKVWENPTFIASGSNCYLDECLAMRFELNGDNTYFLSYMVTDSSSDSIIREYNDRGTFRFNCIKAGGLSGRYSFIHFFRGQLIMNSDSLFQTEWTIEHNGLEGLIIDEEYLGFSHRAYIMLD